MLKLSLLTLRAWPVTGNQAAAKISAVPDKGGFLAHVFWDKYLEYEERQEAHDRVFAILKRVIHIPMHQYARYFDRFHKMSVAQPITALESADVLARYRSEVLAESSCSE
ncbi:hypothetical protein V8F20_008907 [Naviculisporaceae sp. PSN 640]